MGGHIKPEHQITSMMLPKALMADLDAEARRGRVTRSAILRRAAALFLSLPVAMRESAPDPAQAGPDGADASARGP